MKLKVYVITQALGKKYQGIKTPSDDKEINLDFCVNEAELDIDESRMKDKQWQL